MSLGSNFTAPTTAPAEATKTTRQTADSSRPTESQSNALAAAGTRIDSTNSSPVVRALPSRHCALAALMRAANESGSRLAVPTRPPSTSGWSSKARMLLGLIEPP